MHFYNIAKSGCIGVFTTHRIIILNKNFSSKSNKLCLPCCLIGAEFPLISSDHLANPRATSACNGMKYFKA